MLKAQRFSEYRHRITIGKVRVEPAGNYGQSTKNWQPAFETWAKVEVISPREIEVAKQIAPLTQYKITMRWREDVTNEHRVRFGDEIFNIEGVEDVDRMKQQLVFYCVKGKQ